MGLDQPDFSKVFKNTQNMREVIFQLVEKKKVRIWGNKTTKDDFFYVKIRQNTVAWLVFF